MGAQSQPQASVSSYASRLRTYNNALLAPVMPSVAPAGPLSRTTKRGTTMINYAEDGYDDFDDDESDSRRRPTGLRSVRRDESMANRDPSDRVGKDATEPVQAQGVTRDWMSRLKLGKADIQSYAQASLPLTLIPIRIDLDIPQYHPPPAFPLLNPNQPPPPTWDSTNPMFKMGEQTLPYRLRDTFLWNLHETLITTDQFAQTLVQDLDLPSRPQFINEISKQIRTQLEEYAGVALHPLFHSVAGAGTADATKTASAQQEYSTPVPGAFSSRADTPATSSQIPPTPSKPAPPVTGESVSETSNGRVAARASLMAPETDDHSPDDTYRCIINLNIALGSQVYTDKFEWSLLHPPGTAESFAKQTCSDLGLHGEWVPAMTHAIYESVLRLKKEACEAGGLVPGWGAGVLGGGSGEFPNDAAITTGGDGAGWRQDSEHLADEWEPKLEVLSKEEIERREGDRERQLRRLRRETARFSSNTGMAGGAPMGFGFSGLIEQEEERMGRGERSKKKRRFRSLSPLGRSGTPNGRGTPDVGGAINGSGGGGYGGGGTLTDVERLNWRCSHCKVWGTSVWAVRDGPAGPRSLCNNCGFMYERDRKLPRWIFNLHLADIRPDARVF